MVISRTQSRLKDFRKNNRKPEKRKPRNQKVTESYAYFDGRYKIFRTAISNQVYHFHTYLRNEKKTFRRSLQTTDLKEAEKRAETMYFEVQSQSNSGRRIFSLTARELAEKYIEYEQKRLDNDLISIGRFRNIEAHLKHYLRFVHTTTSIANIDPKFFNDYLGHRKKIKKDVRLTTINNELTTIKKMYEFAREEKYVSPDYFIKYEKFKIDKKAESRDAFEIPEYEILISYSKHFYKYAKNEEDEYYCKLMHLFILLMSNLGMRFGELHNLQYEDIKFIKNIVQITIRKEKTKVRRERVILANEKCVEYLERIRKISKFTSRTSYIFSSYRKDTICDKSNLYRCYQRLIERISQKKTSTEFDVTKTFYCLRHFFITIRLLQNVNTYKLARYCGTSLKEIQITYDGMTSLEASKEILKSQHSIKRFSDFNEFFDYKNSDVESNVK